MDTKLIVDRLGGVKHVADVCDLDSSAIYKWIERKRIPDSWLRYFRSAAPEAFLGEAEEIDELPPDITR